MRGERRENRENVALVQRNIVLLPDERTREKVIELNKKLQALGVELAFPEGGHPHLSLYQGGYPADREQEVIGILEKLAASGKPLTITMDGFDVFWGTFIFWDAQRSPELTALHQQLLAALNPVREDRLLPIHQQLVQDESVPFEFRESIRQYGNPLSGSQERPHITIGRMKSADNVQKALEILREETQSQTFTFTIDRIYFTDVGPHGSCPNILKEIPYGSQNS